MIWFGLLNLVLAQDISTDRPSVGTSPSVIDKGSVQVEAGYQRSIATLGNSDNWMTMVRWG